MSLADALYLPIMYLNCVFEIFLLYNFLEASYLVHEKRNSIIFIEGLVCATAIFAVNSLRIPTLNLICVPLILLFYAWLIFRMELKFNLLHTTCYYIIVSICEFIFHYIYILLKVDITDISFSRLIFLILQDVLRFVAIQAIKRQNRNSYHYSKESYQYLKNLYILPIATIILLNGILTPILYPVGALLICIGGILLIVSTVIDFRIVEKLLTAVNAAKEVELLMLKTRLEQKHYQRLEEVNQEYAKYMHEMGRIIRTVEQLACTENSNAIIELAAEISLKGYPIVKKNYSGDQITNAIFIEREKTASDLGVEYNVDIQHGLDLNFIDNLDKISIFGNVLDNALEASSVCDNGYVEASLYLENEAFVIFRVENNFKIKPQKKGREYLTIKKEVAMHGFGIKKVEELSKRYNGIFNIEEEGNTFTVTLFLSNLQILDN